MRKLMTSLMVLALMAIGSSTARAQFTEVCSPNTPVSADGFFNIDVSCPLLGQEVVTGGYSCSCNLGADLLPVTVEVNTFFGGFVGGPHFPNGWQTIGQTLASAVGHSDTFACVNKSSGEVKIVPSCTVGTNASPCHNNDICTDLSGQSTPSACSAPGSNPTCQVCISCTFGPS